MLSISNIDTSVRSPNKNIFEVYTMGYTYNGKGKLFSQLLSTMSNLNVYTPIVN